MTATDTPIINILNSLSSGVLFELSAAVQEAVERSQDTGKMSTVTLALKFKPHGSGRIEIVDELKQNLPSYPRQTTLMYAENGRLTVDDPKQHKLNLKTVDTAPRQFKEVK